MSDAPITLAGLCGSLRRGSFNRMLLRAAHALAPAGVSVEELEIRALPLYDQDLESAAEGPPAPVRVLKERIAAADGLLIATPEYNYSIPGVLKNAIDWASRPAAGSPLRHKPVGLIGASTGMGGTIRAQLALRQCFVFTESYALLKPEVLLARAQEKFDAQGALTDAATRDVVRAFMEALAAWTRRMRSVPAER